MTSSIGLWAGFANVVVLLVLAAAVVSPRVSPLARLVIASFAFACAWLTTVAFDATQAPEWTMFMGGAVIVVSIVVVMATLHLWTQAGDGGESRPEHRDDADGGAPRRNWPDAPQHGGGETDPSWWPDFEGRFALYAAEHERQHRQPAVLPAEPRARSDRAGGPRHRPDDAFRQTDDSALVERSDDTDRGPSRRGEP